MSSFSFNRIMIPISLLLSLLSITSQGQNRFIIGGDWLNWRHSTGGPLLDIGDIPNFQLLSEQLHLNTGITWIETALQGGPLNQQLFQEAANNDIEIISGDTQLNNLTRGQRFVLQAEYPGDFNIGQHVDTVLITDANVDVMIEHRDIDHFYKIPTGSNVLQIDDGDIDADQVVLHTDRPNYLYRSTPDHISRYGLTIRVRAGTNVVLTSTAPIITIDITPPAGGHYIRNLRGIDFRNNTEFLEITLGGFAILQNGGFVNAALSMSPDSGEIPPFVPLANAPGHIPSPQGDTQLLMDVIYHNGSGSIDIDYIAFSSANFGRDAYYLIGRRSEIGYSLTNVIQTEIETRYPTGNIGNLVRLKTHDEPSWDSGNYLTIGYVDRIIGLTNRIRDRGFTYLPCLATEYSPEVFIRAIGETHGRNFNTENRWVEINTPIWNDAQYNHIIQDTVIDGLLLERYIWSARHSLITNIPFIYMVIGESWDFYGGNNQFQTWSTDCDVPDHLIWTEGNQFRCQHVSREPTVEEIRVQANLAVAYNAKGLMYFMVASIDDTEEGGHTGPGVRGLLNSNGTPLTSNSFGQNKFLAIANLNERLEYIGYALLNITWRNTVDVHNSFDAFQDDPLPLIRRVITGDIPITERYVQIGFFTDNPTGNNVPNLIYVVNRRTDPNDDRDITIKLGTSYHGYWRVTNMHNRKQWIVNADAATTNDDEIGGFTDFFLPGDGELYLLESLPPMENFTIFDGCNEGDIIITEGASVTISGSSQNHRVIQFVDNAKLVVQGRLQANYVDFMPCIINPPPNPAYPFTWDGIIADRPSSQLYLLHCGIFNAQSVSVSNQGFGDFQQTTFNTMMNGITLDHASNIIVNVCTFINIYSFGINAISQIQSTFTWNSINGVPSTYTGHGIAFSSSGDALVHKNAIQNFSYNQGCSGLYSSSCPRIHGGYDGFGYFQVDSNKFGRNTIQEVKIGIAAHNNSLIEFGDDNQWGSHNEILNGIYSKNVFSYSGSVVNAQFNHWDNLNPYYFDDGGGAGTIDWRNFIKSQEEQTLYNQSLHDLSDGNFINAIAIYKNLLSSSTLASIPINQLRLINSIAKKYTNDSLVTLLKSYCDTSSVDDIKLFNAELYAYDSYYKQARKVISSLSKNCNEQSKIEALLKDALYSIKTDYDTSYARAALNQVVMIDSTNPQVRQFKNIIDYYILLGEGKFNRDYTPSHLGKNVFSNLSSSDNFFIKNFPNPFNPITNITFKIPENLSVEISIHDAIGRKIKTLVDQEFTSGIHTVIFDGTNLPSGMYFYKFKAGDYTAIKSMALMR